MAPSEKSDDDLQTQKEVGRRIASFAKRAGLNNETVAERLGMTEEGVKKLFNGSNVAGYVKLAKIARAIDTTPNEILGFTEQTQDIEALLDAVRVSYEALGSSRAQAEGWVRAVVEAAQAPPLRSSDLDRRESARARAEIAFQQFGIAKKL